MTRKSYEFNSRTCTHNLLVQPIDRSENCKAVDAPRNSSVQKQTSTSSNCCESSRFVSAATRSEYLYNIDWIALKSLCSADFLTSMSSSLKECLGHQQKYVNHTINPKELKYAKKTYLWDCREISTTTFWRQHDNECGHNIMRVAHKISDHHLHHK
jgi:hypothetical protein